MVTGPSRRIPIPATESMSDWDDRMHRFGPRGWASRDSIEEYVDIAATLERPDGRWG